MNYYLLFPNFISNEGSFTEAEPQVMDFYYPQHKLMSRKAVFNVDKAYAERNMSDFLKVGLGFLVNNKVKKLFFDNDFSGIQFIPVIVNNDKAFDEYSFMNPIAHYDILDASASEAEDFSDVIGGYTTVYEEIIDKNKFEIANIKHDFFTLSNFKQVFYVSENVKEALENEGVNGVEFIPMEFSS